MRVPAFASAILMLGTFTATLGLVTTAPIPHAEASVSLAAYFDDLVGAADAVLVGTPVETKSQWEGTRIITLTRLQIEQRVVGQTAGDVWVRTLGGVVGNIGQSVAGEPTFAAGDRTLVFLKQVSPAAGYLVVRRAQGQFHLRTDPKTQAVTLDPSDSGMLLPPRKFVPNGNGSGASATVSPAAVAPTVAGPVAPKATTRYAQVLARDVFVNRPVADALVDIKEGWTRLHATTP